MTKPVLIEYPDGQRYGVKSAEAATEVHPGARIVSYEDGTPYEGANAKPTSTRKARVSVDPLGELSADDYAALTPAEKGARTRQAKATTTPIDVPVGDTVTTPDGTTVTVEEDSDGPDV